MRNLLTILTIGALSAGCCTFVGDGQFCKDQFTSGVCGGPVNGYTATAIAYGESSIVVIPLTHIKEDTEWRFVLAPIGGTSIQDKTVTITGKPNPPWPGDNVWIDTAGTGGSGQITGSYTVDGTLTACVKPPVPAPSSYYYVVEVDGVGVIDPRADVDP